MRFLRALTPRGKGLVAVGVLLALMALVWGQRDLLSVAILLIVLPIVAGLLVARKEPPLGIERVVTPAHVTVGSVAEVQLAVSNRARRRLGTMLLTDELPPELGAPVRRVLADLPAAQARLTAYPVCPTARGRFDLGPLRATTIDPFGLVKATRVYRDTASVLVVPRVDPLVDGALRADHWGRGEGAAATLAARGDEDVIPREYRQGDDLRRIHWRASARADDLMVRREETPWTRRATVLVDLRASCHAGTGPASSLEVALSAAASVAVHLLRRGWSVRLVSTDGRVLMPTNSGAEGEGALLTTLALVRPWPGSELSLAGAGDGLVVAVVSSERAVAEALGGRLARAPGQSGIALVLDSAAWHVSDALPWTEAVDDLTGAGWHAAVVTGRPGAVAAAWQDATAAAEQVRR